MLSFRRPSHRAVGALVIGTLVLGSAVGAEAATKKPKVVKHTRVVTYQYNGGCGRDLAVVVGDTSPCGVGTTWTLARQKGEKYLTIAVTDQTGRPVGGEIWLTGGTGNATDQAFCGSIKDFQIFQDSYNLDVNSPSLSTTCAGAATVGSVKITYSNLP
jgi:hypothetical protein